MAEPIKQTSVRAGKRASPTSKPAGTKAAAGKTAGAKPLSAKATVAAKPAKAKKPKLVRDSFTIPKEEYAVLAELKQRCATLAQPTKKSELLRAGIKALAGMGDKSLLAALKAVPSIKTGRPKKA